MVTSFYRFKEFYEQGGELALHQISRRKPILKNRVEEHVEKAVFEIAIDQLALSQLQISNELKKQGILISRGGVRSPRYLKYVNISADSSEPASIMMEYPYCETTRLVYIYNTKQLGCERP